MFWQESQHWTKHLKKTKLISQQRSSIDMKIIKLLSGLIIAVA